MSMDILCVEYPLNVIIDMRDIGFTSHNHAILHAGIQGNDLGCTRNDFTSDIQYIINDLDRIKEGAGLLCQSSQDQIAQVMPGDIRLGAIGIIKAVIHQAAHDRFMISQCQHDIADITHSRNIELPAQSAGRAAVICHGHNGRDVGIGNILDAAADLGLAMAAANHNNITHLHESTPSGHGVPCSSYRSSDNAHTGSW